MRAACLAALVLTPWTQAGDPKPKQDAKATAIAKELKALEGTWQYVSIFTQGREVGKAKVGTLRMILRENTWAMLAEGEDNGKGTIKLDPTKEPKAIDQVVTDGPGKGGVFLGIYQLKGDELRWCFAAPNSPRPTAFTTERETPHILLVLRRVKDGKK